VYARGIVSGSCSEVRYTKVGKHFSLAITEQMVSVLKKNEM
jgi:hypothetical protein